MKAVPLTLFFPDHYADNWPRLLRPPTLIAPTLIFNAARPLFGDPVWQGDFNRGRHYAHVLFGDYSDGFIERNLDLDAGLCIELTNLLVRYRVQALARSEGVEPGDSDFKLYFEPYATFESQVDMIRDGFPVLNWTGDNALSLYETVQHIERTGFLP